MDKLKAMQTFVAIADAGSLTAAARIRGNSLPAVVRSLAALEAELGVRLFNRTTRRVTLTETGRRYLERCREAQAIVDEAEAELRDEQTEPRGRLRITAPVLFGQRHLVDGIVAYVQRFPKVNVEVQLLDRVVNLVDEGIDIGIRIGTLDNSSLIAQPVSTMRRLTVAAPSYLARRGAPQHPKELIEHDCVCFWRTGPRAWTFHSNGKPISVPVKGNFTINQSAAAAGACVAGLGIGNFFAYQVAPHVESGALSVVLAAFETPPQPIHIVYPQVRLVPARTRMFIEFIKDHIITEQRHWQPTDPRPPRSPKAGRKR